MYNPGYTNLLKTISNLEEVLDVVCLVEVVLQNNKEV